MPVENLTSNISPLSSGCPLRWLITGGCGFIGTSLIRQLTAEGGHSIRVIDNLSVGTRDDLANVCNFKELTLSSLSTRHSSLSPDVSIAQHYLSSPRLAEKLSRILAGLRKSVQQQKEQSK